MSSRIQLPKLKASTLALSAALAAMAPALAFAHPIDCNSEQIVSSIATSVPWTSGNCEITSTGSIISPSTGLQANVTGNIGNLTNSGMIQGSTNGVNNTAKIGVLSNSGTISGTRSFSSYGITNAGGAEIVELDNLANGTISGAAAGISNIGGSVIDTLTNSITGIISSGGDSGIGIDNESSTINTLNNDGTISGSGKGVFNGAAVISGSGSSALFGSAGTIGNLTNNGLISSDNDIAIVNSKGTITTLTNNGTISGGGFDAISNDNGGFIGTLSNTGTIANVKNGIGNSATIVTLTNSSTGIISSGTSSGIVNSGTIGTLINSGAITGAASGIENNGGTITALTNDTHGVISGGNTALWNGGQIGTLTNNGAIGSTDTLNSSNGIGNIGGNIDLLVNTGTISGQSTGIFNFVSNSSTPLTVGTIGALTNSGTISGGDNGIDNSAMIGTLTNSGAISGTVGGDANGILNDGTIVELDNMAHGTIQGNYTGVTNNSLITTLNNQLGGTISGSSVAVLNNVGEITTLNNSGTISGGSAGVFNVAQIGTLNNATNGTVHGGDFGIANVGGNIDTLTNDGMISSANTAIGNEGTIGTLTNSGTIAGNSYALANETQGTIGAIVNSGVIAGDIRNLSPHDLNISGGTGVVFGTLTGSGSGIGANNIGAMTNTASNVVFSTGNLLLNDNIDVTGHTVINSGATLQVNNIVTVTGDYMQNAGATLNIGVADGAIATGAAGTDSGYGRLVVSGSATFLAGSSVALQKINNYAFAQGQRFVVAQATDAHYNDSALRYSANGYNGAVTGASVTDSDNSANTDLVLTVGAANPPPPSDPADPSTPIDSGTDSNPPPPPAPINSATDSNAVSSLAGLFNYTGTNGRMLNLFNAAAATGGTGEANRAGAQLSPASTGTALVQSVQASSQAVIDVTAARIDTIRMAQASGNGSSGSSGISAGEQPGDTAVWGQAFGGQAHQNDRAGASGYRADYNGMLIGADTALNDQWRAGALFSYSNTTIANGGDNSGSSGHVSSYGLTGYAGYAGEKWYLDLFVGAAQQKYNTFRNVDFSGFNGGASGSFDGMQYSASAQAGYPIRLDAATTVTPIAGVAYSRLHQDGYTESGSAAALQIDSSSTSSIKSDLGARLERSFKTSYGDMIPSAQLSWRHEYRNTRLQSVGSFAADTTGTTSFTTQGAQPEKNSGVLVLGVTLARSENLSVAAHYTLEAAGGYNAQTADVRLRYQF